VCGSLGVFFYLLLPTPVSPTIRIRNGGRSAAFVVLARVGLAWTGIGICGQKRGQKDANQGRISNSTYTGEGECQTRAHLTVRAVTVGNWKKEKNIAVGAEGRFRLHNMTTSHLLVTLALVATFLTETAHGYNQTLPSGNTTRVSSTTTS